VKEGERNCEEADESTPVEVIECNKNIEKRSAFLTIFGDSQNNKQIGKLKTQCTEGGLDLRY
jgi:hypothetical protein